MECYAASDYKQFDSLFQIASPFSTLDPSCPPTRLKRDNYWPLMRWKAA